MEYIYSIRDNHETEKGILDGKGIATWTMRIKQSVTLKLGDIIYIYVGENAEKDDPTDKGKRIRYQAIVLDIMNTNQKNSKNVTLFFKQLKRQSMDKLTFNNLKEFKYNPQNNCIGSDYQNKEALLEYIRNNAECVSTYEEKILYELEKVEDIYIGNNKRKERTKLIGNLVSNVFSKYILEILNSEIDKKEGINYAISQPNSYVRGSTIEWDLIILKREAKNLYNVNVYAPEDVICLLEFKRNGIYCSEKDLENAFSKIEENLLILREKNKNIRFGYITVEENEKYLIKTRDIINNLNNGQESVFCFLNNYKNVKLNSDFVQFIYNLVE